MNTKEAIRVNLEKLMQQSNTRNVDLARAVGVSKSAVTNWLNGSNSIDMDLVPDICKFFGVTVDEFLNVGTSQPISSEERELIDYYRAMPERCRKLLMEIAAVFSEVAT